MRRVYVCSMSRSGGALLYQMLKLFLEHRDIGTGVGFPVGPAEIPDHHRFALYKSEPCRGWIRKQVIAGNAEAIGSYRDPRDVAASLLRFFEARERHKAGQKISENIWSEVAFPALRNAISWYQAWEWLGIYHTRYEMVHPQGWPKFLQGCGIKLGLDLTMAEAKMIYSKFSIAKNAKRQSDQQFWISPSTLLTKEHISENRGRKGTWTDWLTPEQIQQVLDVAGGWMETHGYPLSESD